MPLRVHGLFALALALIAATGAPAHAQATRPWTIPALREWTPAAGVFELNGDSRIVVRSAALLPDAEVFAEDMNTLLGYPVPVVSDPQAVPGQGDVSLALGEVDGRLGREGYRLRIGSAVEITAIESAGAFYGTRTVLQLLHQSREIPRGEVLDWPRYPERGLMIDHGSSYFTPEWIAQHIRELAYLKMNYFHLHFSENGGFRIESETHPEIVSADHLTKQQLSDLVALARRYHIIVVPELDMPGHMGAALAAHPELQLVNAAGQSNANRLDITNPAALQFVRELIEELLPLFPGPYWHIGADEYMQDAELQLYPQLQQYAQDHYGAGATACDAVLGFVNWANGIVKDHGKITRMWHDELNCGAAVLTEDSDITVEWWNNITTLSNTIALGPNALLARGHIIGNSGWFPTYYNNGPSGQYGFPRADMEKAYEHWDVHQFAGAFFSPAVEGQNVQDPPEEISPDDPRNLGSKVNVWTQDPIGESAESIALGIRTFLRVIAQKTWGSERLTATYDEFLPIMNAIGRSPGFYAPAGTEVGFWAQQNADGFTPEVYDVLQDTGGALYLLVEYPTDFSFPGRPAPRTFAREVTLEANRRGIPVNAWITVPVQDGIFAHENNAELIQQAVQALPGWMAADGLRFREATLDLEFPVGNGAVFDAFSGDPSALADAMRANVDPVHQCQAMTTYRDTISWAHVRGMRISGSPAPFFLDDLEDGYTALQDALDGVAFPPLGYEALYLQAYRTYSNAGPGYVAQFYRDMQRHFGASGQVSLGDTQQGPPYDVLENLVADVRMLAGMGATAIPIFELSGTVQKFGPEGLRAIVEAGREPLSGAELAAMAQESEYDRSHREFFRGLDAAAVEMTNAATAPPGEPDGPNAYPDGCGDMHALPEPGADLALLGALPLLAWLGARRATRLVTPAPPPSSAPRYRA